MFTSDDRDNFEGDDSVLDQMPFSSDHRQYQVHYNHHQLSLFDLPSPYPFQFFSNDFDYPERAGLNLDLDLDLILFHQQLQMQQQPKPQHQQQQEATLNFIHGEGESNIRAAVSPAPQMRSSKKDRHSKITTARGPRDRRMRLSLEVAREFFDLQDMLGFDKASKTVEWLISQSASAIKEIIRKVKGSGRGGGGDIAASYTSDCEIGYNHSSDDDGRDRTVESSADPKRLNEVRRPRQPRRSYCHRQSSLATRESRQKARERARKRTLEKKWMWTPESSRLNRRQPCSSSHQTGESSCVQTGTTGPNMEILTAYEEITAGHISVDVSSDLVCGKWSPAMASSSNLNLQEIGIPRFNQQRDYEQYLMQWEAYSNYGYNQS